MKSTARILILLFILIAMPATAYAKRVALVIGNAVYEHKPSLANPVNDAKAIRDALMRLGFDVTFEDDLGIAGMREAILDFGDKAAGAEMAVVFYAGHGIELEKENYLIPTDARLKSDRSVSLETIPLQVISDAVSSASKLRLIILDACRDNPFLTTMKVTRSTRSVSRGLAAVEPEAGTLIAFAAREGAVASDGDDGHSPFTAALLDHLEEPGLEIDFMFRKVRDRVMEATNGEQQPFRYGSLPGTQIFLKEAESGSDDKSEAAEAWLAVKDSQNIAMLEAFEKRFGDTFFGEMARIAIDELRQDATTAKTASEPEKKVAALVPEKKDEPIAITASRSWRMASTMPRGLAVFGELAEAVPEAISDVSGGKLKVEYFGAGEVVGAFETFDAVASGNLEFGWSNAAYWVGKNPAFPLFSGSVPFGMTPERLVTWLQQDGGKLRDELYAQYNIKSISCGIVGPESGGWFKKELHSADDIKGLVMRIAGPAGEIFREAGGKTALLPGGEIYPALELGALDGTEFGTPAFDLNLRFYEVAPYYYYPAWHQPTTLFDLIINLDIWNGMSRDEQRAIQAGCDNRLRDSLHKIPLNQSQGLEAIREKGIEIRAFPDDILATLRAATEKKMNEKAAEDEFYARVKTSFDNYR